MVKKGEFRMIRYKKLAQGRTADIYYWEENKVLKLFIGVFPRKTAQKEFSIVRELAKKRLPVPEVYELINHEGRWGIIFERVNGVTMLEKISSSPEKVMGEARKLAELHKSFQIKVDVSLPGFKSFIKESISRVKEINEKNRDYLLEKLNQLPEGDKLCHGDFHPDNVIIGREKAMVIDWVTAAVGDPLADVARTSIIFKFGALPEQKSEPEIRAVNLLRKKFYNEYITHYIKITGSDCNLIKQWELPLAAARLEERIPPQEKKALLDFVEGNFV